MGGPYSDASPSFTQMSLFPTVEEQIEQIAQSQAEASAPAFSVGMVPEQAVERILSAGTNEPAGALRIYAQYQGSADVNMGRGAIVIGLAAVIISEVLFEKICAGRKIAFAYTLFAVFIGAILYYVVIGLVLWLKMPSDYMKLFSAVVVACFLSIPYLRQKYLKKKGVVRS